MNNTTKRIDPLQELWKRERRILSEINRTIPKVRRNALIVELGEILNARIDLCTKLDIRKVELP